MIDDEPKIGKHVLALLTTGMYKEPRLIYREYIQNSADQIDLLPEEEKNNQNRCRIVIDIDREKARVVVKDFATGIKAREFKKRLLNVADSWKDPSKDKGFRGIGRLAGLAYCHKLIFETSAEGERIVSRMEMDGDEMRRILRDRDDRCSAGELVKRIASVSQKEEDIPEYECYFKVTLEGVIEAVGGSLLDVEGTRDLIGQIAPVAFSPTVFKKWKEKIEGFAERLGHPLQTYSIQINGQALVKPYKTNIKGVKGETTAQIEDVVFRKITGEKGKLLGWAWAAVPDQGRSIVESQNHERMMRLRKDNIQIGMHDFFQGSIPDGGMYFPELRANGYMLGEVHIVDSDIRPNADRNDLEVSEAASKFLKKLKETLFIDLWNAAKEGNALSKALENIETYKEMLAQKGPTIKDKSVPFSGRKKIADALSDAYNKALSGLHELEKAKQKLSGKKPNTDSAMELLRFSKTRDLDKLKTLVTTPPKLAPQEPDSVREDPFADEPPKAKRPGAKSTEKPVHPQGKVFPSRDDELLKILTDSGLSLDAAIEALKKINRLFS